MAPSKGGCGSPGRRGRGREIQSSSLGATKAFQHPGRKGKGRPVGGQQATTGSVREPVGETWPAGPGGRHSGTSAGPGAG